MQHTKPLELATPNGNGSTPGKFDEVGSVGLESYSGYLNQAYIPELTLPTALPVFKRLYRSDPEIALKRFLFSGWGGKLALDVHQPDVDKPTDDDKRAVDFSYSVMQEMDGGGLEGWLTDAMMKVDLYGWGWWMLPVGVRKPDWKPPQDDPWRSDSDDGLLGYRRAAFRDYSSWHSWQMDDYTGRMFGMNQWDSPNPLVEIPLDRSLHLTFGDHNSPEGLPTMEALYRLERYKYSLEVIQGIGYEHAGGHLNVKSTEQLTTEDHTNIRRAAMAIMSVQPGNYMAWPKNLEGSLVDVPFSAAPALLEAIRYYSILKLAVMGMGWLANASGISGVGSFANVRDGSEMAVMLFNAMAEDFVRQADEQIWKRLFTFPVNKAAFPNLTKRPQLKLIPLSKNIPLTEMAQLIPAMAAIMPLGDDDFKAIRRKTEFLPETLPEIVSPVDEQPEDETVPDTDDNEQGAEDDAAESLESDGTPEVDEELSELALTVADKVKLRPKHMQTEINETRREFENMRAGWRKQRAINLKGITDKQWDEAMQKDLETEDTSL